MTMRKTNVLSQLMASAPRREFASVEQERAYKTAADALNADAQARWGDPTWHREQAALIAERLEWGFQNDNILGSYFPTQSVGQFDKVVLEELRGLKVFWTARNGQIDESQMSTDRFELPRETLGWHVSEFEDNWQADYAATVEKLVAYARLRETAEVNRRIFSVLQEAIPSSSPYFEDASSAGLKPEVLNPLLSEVADIAPPSNGSLSMPLAIVGRAAAIDQISDFTNFAPEAQEEIRKKGRLGVYRGANIVRITNWTDEDGKPYIPEDEVFVMGGDLGRFVSYGDAKFRTWSEDATDHFHARSRRDIGLAIYRPQFARRIKVA
jgi:hypothetical protein